MGAGLNAADIREALTRRWPDSQYLHIPEATINPWRQGRKIDLLVVGCWKSLRYELDAVEVKCSVSDFRNELECYHWQIEGSDEKFYNRDHAAYRSKYDLGTWTTRETPLAIKRYATPDLSKSEAWRATAHRFWIAAPADVAARIKPILPEGWGLLAVADETRQFVKPAKNPEPLPIPWPGMIGLMRSCLDASGPTRQRFYDRGYREGLAAAPVVPSTHA